LNYWVFATGSRLSAHTNIGVRLLVPTHRRNEPIEQEDSAKKAINAWKKYQAEQTGP